MLGNSTLRRRARRTAVALSFTVSLAGLVGASSASATTEIWRGGSQADYVGPGSPWRVGPPHSITSNNAWIVGDACVGAIDVNGGQLSGAGTCGNWGYWSYVTHPYCGCVLRDPAVYPNQGTGGWVGSASMTY